MLAPALSLALALCLHATPVAADEIDPSEAFRSACGPCHATNRGHRIGPSLLGVNGRLSGTAPGFDYSPAMRALAVRWDADSIDRFLVTPKAMVPGTSMSFAGMKDSARRRAIVEYVIGLRRD